MYGVDISAHQAADAVRQLAAKGKASFVITRNSSGSYTPDSDLASFMADINRYGLKNSAYVASYAKDEAEAAEEADFLVSLVEKYGNRPELPLFFDWAYFSADYIKKQFGIEATKELVQKITAAFCERIKEHGYTAGVYCNLDFMQRFYTPEFWAAHPDYKLWYARPGLSKPDKECYIWQYASNNGLNDFGYNGDIDKNIMYGEFVEEVEPMKPLSYEPIRMYIGFASAGDIHTLKVKLEGLGIPVEDKDGYIITGYMSSGDQCYIMTDCNRLGVPYKIYEEDLWSNELYKNKLYKVTATNNQYFNTRNVNDVVNYLPVNGEYDIISASTKEIDGFNWVKIFVEGAEYFAVILDDRCEIIDKSAQYDELVEQISQLEKELETANAEITELKNKLNNIHKESEL